MLLKHKWRIFTSSFLKKKKKKKKKKKIASTSYQIKSDPPPWIPCVKMILILPFLTNVPQESSSNAASIIPVTVSRSWWHFCRLSSSVPTMSLITFLSLESSINPSSCFTNFSARCVMWGYLPSSTLMRFIIRDWIAGNRPGVNMVLLSERKMQTP